MPELIPEHFQGADWAGSATISECSAYRYVLTRSWGDGLWGEESRMTFVMLNPSTADSRENDPTIRRCSSFARREGCGGVTVVNLFAYRATEPSDLRSAADPVGVLNDQYIREECQPGAMVVAAWGAHGTLAGRAEAVTRMLWADGVQLFCLGVTRDGHPRHPLYVPGSAPFVPYSPKEEAP